MLLLLQFFNYPITTTSRPVLISIGYSGADMANLCREAALGPIRDAAHDIQHIAAEEVSSYNTCSINSNL